MWALLDGEFVDKDAGVICLENRGLTFSDGLFEVLRIVAGRVLFFADHFRRMARSARAFGIDFSYGEAEMLSRAMTGEGGF